MADKQTYVVETVYQTVNKSSAPISEIAKAAQDAARASQTLTTVIKGMGAAFIGSRVFSEAKKMFIDYNKDIENHKTVLSGMMMLYTGAGIDKTWDRAGRSVAAFEQMAKRSSLTTADLVQTASGLTRPLLQAGLSMGDIEKMTFGVANAAKAFGMNGSVVAMDIEQALTANVGQRDRFTRNILAQKGVDLTAEKFNALGTQKRVEALQKALTSTAILEMAKKQGEDTFGGVLSTLEDNFQIIASKIGLPLFKAITEEVKSWNAWIEKNNLKLKDIGQTVTDSLMKGFHMMKDVFSWIYDHADTLITVAKAYALIKVGGMLGGGVGGSMMSLVGGGAGLAGAFSKGGWRDGKDENGNYVSSFEGPGRARRKMGLKDIGDSAGLLGTIGALGYGLGTLMNNASGLSDSIMGVRTVNGEVLDVTDKSTRQYGMLITSMKAFDRSVVEAADRLSKFQDARGTTASSNLQGTIDVQKRQANVIGDAIRDGLAGGKGDLAQAKAYMRVKASGLFEEDEISKIFSNPQMMQQKFAMAAQSGDLRIANAQATADTAWESIPAELRKSLDQGKVLQALMAKTLQMMGPMESGKFQSGIILSKEMIDQAMKEAGADADLRGEKTTKQTVNITIQQVMAKDPNRWLAEMDDMVSRRTRNPSRAKKAWRNSPK